MCADDGRCAAACSRHALAALSTPFLLLDFTIQGRSAAARPATQRWLFASWLSVGRDQPWHQGPAGTATKAAATATVFERTVSTCRPFAHRLAKGKCVTDVCECHLQLPGAVRCSAVLPKTLAISLRDVVTTDAVLELPALQLGVQLCARQDCRTVRPTPTPSGLYPPPSHPHEEVRRSWRGAPFGR